MIEELKTLFASEGISFREIEKGLRVSLPNGFGELEIGFLEENDTIIGLVGYDWHTHGDVLKYYGGNTETEAIASFVKGIFSGKFRLIELIKDGKTIDKYIEDDSHDPEKYLEKGETVRICN